MLLWVRSYNLEYFQPWKIYNESRVSSDMSSLLLWSSWATLSTSFSQACRLQNKTIRSLLLCVHALTVHSFLQEHLNFGITLTPFSFLSILIKEIWLIPKYCGFWRFSNITQLKISRYFLSTLNKQKLKQELYQLSHKCEGIWKWKKKSIKGFSFVIGLTISNFIDNSEE